MQVTQQLSNQLVDEGSDARFQCKFDNSTDSSSVSWSKDGQRIDLADKYKHSFVAGTSTLNINGASIQDEGLYKCELIDGDSKVDTEAKLTVNRKGTETKTTVEAVKDGDGQDEKPDTGTATKKKRIKRRTGSDIEPPKSGDKGEIFNR